MSNEHLKSGQLYGESSQNTLRSSLILGDSLQVPITTVTFYGTNYLYLVEICVDLYSGQGQGQGQGRILIGEIVIPSKVYPKYQKWKTQNVVVKGWLLSSMKPKIGDHYFLEMAHQI